MSLVEEARQHHEDAERAERAAARALLAPAPTHRARLQQAHRAKRLLRHASGRAAKLRRLYDDADRSRRDEIAALGAGNVFSAFYDRLKEVRDFHRQYPGLQPPRGEEQEAMLEEDPLEDVRFTGEEGLGRFLDLHDVHRTFQNAPFGGPTDYLAFLEHLSSFHLVPRRHKFGPSYPAYIKELTEYLLDFHARALPLTDTAPALADAAEKRAKEWDAGEAPGWEDRGDGAAELAAVELDAAEGPEDLASKAPEAMRGALWARGLATDGEPAELAERLWASRGAELPAEGEKARRAEEGRALALLEARATCAIELLREQLAATRGNVERKQTMSYAELQAEAEEQEEAVDIDSDEDTDAQLHNPLKLPLGWDGKPIPYWMYKLHGLNVEFKCEICGNFSYWGRRAFERHFKEWRHQHGMKCLGIPNTRAFLEVTSIEHAQKLHAAITARKQGEFRAEEHEECEDAEGNVYGRKTYEDLKRQGII